MSFISVKKEAFERAVAALTVRSSGDAPWSPSSRAGRG